jgi:hypothetical protein
LIAGACLLPAFAQTGVIAQGSVTRKDFGFYWQTRLEPPSPPLANSLGYASGANPKNNNIYRVMIDRARHVYFGYEVRVEPLPQSVKYRVAFQQLDLAAEILQQIHIDDPASWSKLQLGAPVGRPLYPFRDAPDIVGALDVIAVDLMMNPGTGQKIVDYVVLQSPSQSWSFDQFNQPLKRDFVYAPGTPRDFSIEDASLRLAEPRVSINGAIEETTARAVGEVSGPAVWFSLRNRGRYILSLVPRPDLGFNKAGEVRGTSLTFTLGDTFTVNSAKTIAPGEGPFNLYVRYDAGWSRPSYPNADLSAFVMGADRAEALVRK